MQGFVYICFCFGWVLTFCHLLHLFCMGFSVLMVCCNALHGSPCFVEMCTYFRLSFKVSLLSACVSDGFSVSLCVSLCVCVSRVSLCVSVCVSLCPPLFSFRNLFFYPKDGLAPCLYICSQGRRGRLISRPVLGGVLGYFEFSNRVKTYVEI